MTIIAYLKVTFSLLLRVISRVIISITYSVIDEFV